MVEMTVYKLSYVDPVRGSAEEDAHGFSKLETGHHASAQSPTISGEAGPWEDAFDEEVVFLMPAHVPSQPP